MHERNVRVTTKWNEERDHCEEEGKYSFLKRDFQRETPRWLLHPFFSSLTFLRTFFSFFVLRNFLIEHFQAMQKKANLEECLYRLDRKMEKRNRKGRKEKNLSLSLSHLSRRISMKNRRSLDRPLIRDKERLIQEFLMADPRRCCSESRSQAGGRRGGKEDERRRRLILEGRRFAKKKKKKKKKFLLP